MKDTPRLKSDDTFRFGCGPESECFNRCCRGVNVLLTPYDVVRLKRRLGISSEEFLRLYAVVPTADGLRYPVVALRMRKEPEARCPFLEEPNGCAVYEDRPRACRMYPLGLAEPPEGDEAERFRFGVGEDFCRGRGQGREWTVAEWLASQGAEEYEREGRPFQEILHDPRLMSGSAPPPAAVEMLFIACYDLDRFRRFVFESRFAAMFEIAPERLEAARTDDLALARLGADYMRFALFGDPSMTAREDVARARRESPGTAQFEKAHTETQRHGEKHAQES